MSKYFRLFSIRNLLVLVLIAFVFAYFSGSDNLPKHSSIAQISINGLITTDQLRSEKIREMRKSDKIQALIVYFNSPGGTVVGGEQLFHSLDNFSKEKPLVVVMEEIATSAAYMAALSGSRIFASKGTITGSIGAIWQTAEITKLLDKMGITTEAIKSDQLKASPSPLEPMTEKSRALIKGAVDDAFQTFLEIVKTKRSFSENQIQLFSDGRIFTVNQAIKVGLIDEIGGQEEAVSWLERERKIDKNLPLERIEIDYPKSFLDVIFGYIYKENSLPKKVMLEGLLSLWHGGIH
ncbi:MAG: signal peptide peptidase SppA [Pseudomonadota bacterium]|nr:signal peptide peptidase SppA [Pseudomonadota bacterium]